ncbi:UBX domain-containing protein 4 [Papilio machaon]|uniref:UBX domain-containing protein 4 n=2 Tax=Papilio machaon TaxID=76193 RepID=A0A194R0U0_PAPMA|nr:UBX domain-containing protein 4 [Papilio machaon]
MHWYGGSIAEAVALSKQRNAIFVVFVEGDNEQSAEMSSTIDNVAVEKRLSDPENFLAIKLKSGSINYTHFAQIYQFVPVPSLFFINRNGTPLEVVCAGVEAQNLATRIDRIIEEHNQFVPVPSLFFINRNGTPLEVVCAGVEAQNLATRIDRIIEEHNKDKKGTVQPSTSGQNLKQQTANLIQAEAGNPGNESVPATPPTCTTSNEAKTATPSTSRSSIDVEPETSSGPAAKVPKTEFHEVTRSGQEYEVVCDGDVCVRKPKEKLEEPGPSTKDTPANKPAMSAASSDEKVERAKELIEAVKKEKLEKEKELEKQKELERRAVGQGVTELKKWQAEQELKQLQEERKREKMENNLARQRILEQIAQDRAERRARDMPPPQTPQPPQTSQPSPPPSTVGDGGSRARVQFKMADGNAHTAHFDVDTTLLELRRYVSTNLHLRQSEFSLWTAFPRQELTEEGSTLRQLRLAPSAALLVLPRRVPDTVATPTTFSNIIWRTFGRPFKKMAAALIPLVFQMGAAATWAVVAALVGIKTLGVTLIILKLLLIAGAVKIGALFGQKGHHSSGWEPPPHTPQKEIHLHIHNGQHGHSGPDEHIPFSSWSRDGTQSSSDTKPMNVVYEPYVAGPQTISTPYGNYVKI